MLRRRDKDLCWSPGFLDIECHSPLLEVKKTLWSSSWIFILWVKKLKPGEKRFPRE